MTLVGQPSEDSDESIPSTHKLNSKAGLASLLLTVVELIRQLMEAQVIRHMD